MSLGLYPPTDLKADFEAWRQPGEEALRIALRLRASQSALRFISREMRR